MERPVTSKSRGICKYYNTPRGCFAGDNCKFKHGEHEKLTPYDNSKSCRYFAAGPCLPLVCQDLVIILGLQGFCKWGEKCWFRHDSPANPPTDPADPSESLICVICMEEPATFGLLGSKSIDTCQSKLKLTNGYSS
jgi:E3 ubiquitin-protein ligase makorin